MMWRELRLVIASILVAVLHVGPILGTEAGDEGTPPVARAAPRSFRIASVPQGLSVYLASADDPAIATAKSVGQVMVTNSKYLRGATPVSMTGLNSGRYIVGLAPMRGTPDHPDLALVCEDPSLKLKEYLVITHAETIKSVISAPGTESLSASGSVIAAFYEIEINADSDGIIILAVPSKASPEDLDRLYPSGENYTFDEQDLAAQLKEKADSEKMRRQFALLHRGGKIVMRFLATGIVGGGIGALELRTIVDCSKRGPCSVSRSVGKPN